MSVRTARTSVTLFAGLATLLATSALWPLLETERWPYAAFLAVAVVAATGWLARYLRVPALLAPLLPLATLTVLLTVMYAPQSTVFAVVPTPASLDALRDLLVSGLVDVRRYATPAPESAGLMLVTTGGVGLVALLVDFLAVGLRRPAVAGLPMLAIYSVSAGVLTDGPGWIAFLAGASGFLALLIADHTRRVEGWGRPVVVRRPTDRRTAGAVRQRANTAPLTSLGRRIGLFAVLTAVVLPMIVPLSDRSLLAGEGDGSSWLSRFGAPTLRAPDPVASMRRDLLRQSDEVLFTYQTTAENPEYLRTVGLTEFDGEAWRPGRLRGYEEFAVEPDVTLPQPTGSDPTITRTVRTSVQLADEASVDYLPAPYAPAQVNAGEGWYYAPSTLTIFAPSGSDDGISYTVTSEVPRPRPTQLDVAAGPGAAVERALRLPRGLPPEVRDAAEQVTRDADTRYRKALALQEWFTDTGGFTYSTEPGGNGEDALRSFLRTRRGYCEQYASAMAVMARMLDIPARVAVGFTQGTRRDEDTWVVRGSDAHAWPELWFESVGWIRFEPTPSGVTGQGTADTPGYSESNALQRGRDNGDDDLDNFTATGGAVPTGQATGRQRIEPTNQPARGQQDSGVSIGVVLGLFSALVGVLLAAFVPSLARRLIRRRRWARARDPVSVAHVAWRELTDDVTDLRFALRPAETPRATGARLAERLATEQDAQAAATRLAVAEEHARYAPQPRTPAGLPDDVRTVRAALARQVSRKTRLRAALVPPSVGRALVEWVRGVGGKYERFGTATGSRIGTRRRHV